VPDREILAFSKAREIFRQFGLESTDALTELTRSFKKPSTYEYP
jgi:hypothetical protein